MYTRHARTKSRNPPETESPRHGSGTEPLSRPPSARAPPRGQQEQSRHDEADDGQRQQPACDQFPCRQREKIEIQWPAKYRICDASSRMRRIPVERQVRPLRFHRGSGHNRHQQRPRNGGHVHHGRHWQLDRLASENNRMRRRQVRRMSPLECEERAQQNHERDQPRSPRKLPTPARAFSRTPRRIRAI